MNGLALVRFNANGTLDTTFGSGGEVLTSFSAGTTSLAVTGAGVVVTNNGQIVECGEDSTNSYTVLARFNANGTLDTTFGQGGKVIMSGPVAANMVQQSDGRLLVVGNEGNSGAVLRYNANGSLDTTFASGGIATNAAFGLIWGAAEYPSAGTANDDKIVVVGGGGPSGGWEAARYNSDGSLDSTFGSGGLVNTQTGTSWPRSVAIQGDSKVVATGDGSILVRYNADGSLDGTFGTGGIVTTKLPTSTLRSAVLQTNGDIVVAGQASTFFVARFLPSAPEITTFTASPNPVSSGSSVLLTASGITDGNPNSTIKQVAFYLNGTLLGTGTQTSPGVWTLTYTASLAPGTYTLTAQATDSYGVFGDPFALTFQVS